MTLTDQSILERAAQQQQPLRAEHLAAVRLHVARDTSAPFYRGSALLLRTLRTLTLLPTGSLGLGMGVQLVTNWSPTTAHSLRLHPTHPTPPGSQR